MIWLAAAGAHVGDVIDTVDADLVPDGLVVEATFGLLVPSEAGGSEAFDWVCHESVTEPDAVLSPSYAFAGGRTVAWMLDLTQARDGIPVWSSDDRCAWTPATGLDGRLVAEASVAPDLTVWAATADEGQPNALLAAPDGVAFAPVLSAPGRFVSVRADGPAIWAVSLVGEDQVTLWHSPDGLIFTPHAVPVPADAVRPVRARLADVHPEDGGQAWLVLDPVGSDQLLHATSSGADLAVRWEVDDRITDVAWAPDGTLYAVLGALRPWRARPDGPFEPLEAFVDTAGLDADASRVALAHRTFVSGLIATESPDGDGPTAAWGPDSVRGTKACPPASDVARLCEPLWDVLHARLLAGGDTSDTGRPVPPGDTDTPPGIPRRCGCVSGGVGPTGPAAAWLLAGWVLLRTRSTRSGAR